MAEADAEAGFENGQRMESFLLITKVLGGPEFQKLRKKDLVTSALSWFKVLRATSMNQKFPYILRISEKAKHVRFQVSVEKGLEIVVPKRFSASRVPSLVEKNSQWIERAFQKAKAFQGLIGPVPVWQMPEEITSLALDLTWRVLTRRDDMKSVVERETSATTLVMHGATDDAAACQTALKGWLTHKAEEHLIPWLKRVSDETGLSYSSVSIRQQQTRWGSCSSRRLISLNARLLFLPPDLVTYVLVHELCHTKSLKPFTQILAIGRVLSTRLSAIRSATAERRPMHARMADSILRSEGREIRVPAGALKALTLSTCRSIF